MRADRTFPTPIQQLVSLMAMAVYGEHYTAVSDDLVQWVIIRGRFEMGRFIGSPEEVSKEIKEWDQTVIPIQEKLPMNQKRLKKINEIAAGIRSTVVELESLKDEEQEAFDNLPEGLQGGDKGQAMEEAINTLDEAINSIGDGADQLDGIGT